MAEGRRCAERNLAGEPCGSWAMLGERTCFRHSPEHAEAAADASRLGGLRRRKQATVEQIYDFDGFESAEEIRRLLHIAAIDTLAQENTLGRSRALTYIASEARRLLETGQLQERVEALERALAGRKAPNLNPRR